MENESERGRCQVVELHFRFPFLSEVESYIEIHIFYFTIFFFLALPFFCGKIMFMCHGSQMLKPVFFFFLTLNRQLLGLVQ